MLPAFPVFFSWLPHFRSERDDLGELLVAQFAGYRPEDARPNRLVRIVNQYRRVIVKTDVRSVLAPLLFARAHNHALHHRSLLYLAFRLRFLHRRRDDVAQSRRQSRISSERKDAGQLARAGIVRHRQPCSHLYHDRAPCLTAAPLHYRRNFHSVTPRASSVATLPSTASASISKAAAWKQSAPCRPRALRRSRRARSISWCGALPGDTA